MYYIYQYMTSTVIKTTILGRGTTHNTKKGERNIPIIFHSASCYEIKVASDHQCVHRYLMRCRNQFPKYIRQCQIIFRFPSSLEKGGGLTPLHCFPLSISPHQSTFVLGNITNDIEMISKVFTFLGKRSFLNSTRTRFFAKIGTDIPIKKLPKVETTCMLYIVEIRWRQRFF